MKEMINKINALIESEEKELKEIESAKRDVETRLDSDESFSMATCHTLIHMLMEFDTRTSLHKTFIKQLKDMLPESETNEEEI